MIPSNRVATHPGIILLKEFIEPLGLKVMTNDPDMLDEYDFSKGVRGKYTARYSEGTNVVVIDTDVAKYFPDHDSVNEALRSLLSIVKRDEQKSS